MSDIKLTRPAAAATVTIEPNKGDNFAIAFDPSEAVMSQQDGNLVFTFEDGAQLVVANFYGVYSKDEAPSFSFEDTVFTAQEFFAAQGAEDLMPAAGPGQGQAQASSADGGGRYSDYGDAALLNGLNKLGGLDYNFTLASRQTEELASAGLLEGSDGDRGAVAMASVASFAGGGTTGGGTTGGGTTGGGTPEHEHNDAPTFEIFAENDKAIEGGVLGGQSEEDIATKTLSSASWPTPNKPVPNTPAEGTIQFADKDALVTFLKGLTVKQTGIETEVSFGEGIPIADGTEKSFTIYKTDKGFSATEGPHENSIGILVLTREGKIRYPRQSRGFERREPLKAV